MVRKKGAINFTFRSSLCTGLGKYVFISAEFMSMNLLLSSRITLMSKTIPVITEDL